MMQADIFSSIPVTSRIRRNWTGLLLAMCRLMLASALFGIVNTAVGCAPLSEAQSQDVGNMAYPAPLAQGNLETTKVAGRRPQDTGNMLYPAPLPQGNISTTVVYGRQNRDVGNMSYPDPTPPGEVAP